jgi:uncharacterized membrane protein
MFEKIILALMYAFLNATGASIIKNQLVGKNLNGFTDYVRVILDFKVIFGFFVIFLSVLAMFKLLTLAKLSFAVPVSTAMNFIITILFASIFFNEKLTLTTFISVLLILGGIVLYSTNKA